jgi:hypothetical protein
MNEEERCPRCDYTHCGSCPPVGDILEIAASAVSGDRLANYGTPMLNHGATAQMFSAYMQRKYGERMVTIFDAHDVCVFNICQKLSRLANTPWHEDSLVDIAGYVANIGTILNEQYPPTRHRQE